MSVTTSEETTTLQKGFVGQSIPRKEDRRLVEGQGVFFDDVKRHGMGYLHFVRSPYAHARIESVDVSAALELPGVYGTLTGDEVAILTDPFFQIAAEPGGSVKDYALAVGKVRYIGEPVVAVVAETRELARDAAELVVVDYEPLDVVVDARKALEDGAPILHEECGGNMSYSGVWEWGDLDAAFAEADHVVKISELHFDRFNSTPLELDGALVEFNRGTGQWTITTNNQFPGFAVIMMAPAMRVGTDKLRIVTQDIGGGFGNKITSHPQLVACCLLARKLNRPIQWTEWRTDFHQSMSHGNERWFLDTEVAVKADGTMLGFRTKAIDDAGAYLRYEPLGGVIWAQVSPGMYRWRNIRVEFTQAMTNKAPCSPNRGYSRMQHLWLTERIIDIVAAELGMDRVEIRKKNYVQPEDMPYETPNGCVYDSGDYPRALDMALELIGYDTIEERRAEAASRGKLLGVGIGSTLDSGTNNFGQSQLINPDLQFSGNNEVATVKLDIFGEIVVTLGTTPQGQGHETTAAQVVADILGCDVDIVHVRAGHDSYWNSHAGFSGTYASQFAVTGLGAVKGATDELAEPDEDPRLDGLPVPDRGDRARRRVRADQGQPRGGAAVHGARRDPEREQRRVPGRPAADERPLRLPAAVRRAGQGAEVREADADVRDADPRLRRRGRSRDGRLRDRRLRRRRRLRRASQPADRRGAGDGRDRARDRRRDVRVVHVRRGGQPPDAQLLRLPRAAHARHAAAADGGDRVALAVHAARHEGDGRGWRRRDPLHRRRAPGRAPRVRRRARDRQPQPVPPRLGDAPRARAVACEGGGDVEVKLEGTKEFDAPREVVWSVINDPSKMAKTMPGVESFEIADDTHWSAKVKVPLGLGGLKMSIAFTKLEERPLEFASLNAKGQGVGAMMNMTTSFSLSGDGETTSMAWEADVKIAGPVGSMGQRVLQPIINQQVGNVLAALDAEVQAAKAAAG